MSQSSSPQPSAPTGHLARWQVITIVGGAVLWLPLMPLVIGAFLFLAAIAIALIGDWHGASTLNNLVDWSRVHRFRWLVISFFVLFYMFLFYIYAWRVFRSSSEYPLVIAWARQSNGNTALAGIVVLVLIIGNMGGIVYIESQQNASAASNTIIAPDAHSDKTPSSAVIVPGSTPISTPTVTKPIQVPPTATTKPASSPNTAVPQHPATATPLPPKATAIPPTAAPVANTCGAPANPWGYNFCGGTTIANPPGNFCDYFNCIASFWTSTNGVVEECADLTFSHSGGRQGSCSHHGSDYRPLYQP